jgi:micrococcal nuclease
MRKKRRRGNGSWGFILVLCMILSSCGTSSEPADARNQLDRIAQKYPQLHMERASYGKVKRVVDGDTFELDDGDKIRLIGVNTPETHGVVERFGKESAAYTEKRLRGHMVLIIPDVSDRDRYGRLLRYVFLEGENVMINEQLVTEGYAQVMTVPPNVTLAEMFRSREREARTRNAGLWGDHEGNAGQEKGAAGSPGPSAPPSCEYRVKGNINAKGSKIYHIPGGASYDRTVPEQWFCSEEEALTAGFRKAPR